MYMSDLKSCTACLACLPGPLPLASLTTTCAGQRIIKSIAPSIYGHEFIKTGLAMALFGGMVSRVAGCVL
jgi:hypothetical protein